MCLETKQIHNTKSQFFQMSAKIMTCSLSPKKNTDNLIINIEIKTSIKIHFALFLILNQIKSECNNV